MEKEERRGKMTEEERVAEDQELERQKRKRLDDAMKSNDIEDLDEDEDYDGEEDQQQQQENDGSEVGEDDDEEIDLD